MFFPAAVLGESLAANSEWSERGCLKFSDKYGDEETSFTSLDGKSLIKKNIEPLMLGHEIHTRTYMRSLHALPVAASTFRTCIRPTSSVFWFMSEVTGAFSYIARRFQFNRLFPWRWMRMLSRRYNNIQFPPRAASLRNAISSFSSCTTYAVNPATECIKTKRPACR